MTKPPAPGAFKEIVKPFDAEYEFLGNQGQRVWLRTDKGAPRGRVVAFDLASPGEEHSCPLTRGCAKKVTKRRNASLFREEHLRQKASGDQFAQPLANAQGLLWCPGIELYGIFRKQHDDG